jgi:hypothetical protein
MKGILSIPVAAVILSMTACAQSKKPTPPVVPQQVIPVPAQVDPAEYQAVEAAWKDVEIAQLRLQIQVQAVLVKHPGYTYNISQHMFQKPSNFTPPTTPAKKKSK